MKDLLKQWGKHVVALILFLGLVMTYFSPAVFDGKVIMQGDNIKATGMGSSQMDQYAETAQPGEFSVWSDAMFGGMPYVTGYGQAAPSMPSYSIVDGWLKKVGYGDAAMVFVGLVCFYLLMCVMGVNWWLAIAGAFARFGMNDWWQTNIPIRKLFHESFRGALRRRSPSDRLSSSTIFVSP